jgi:hypothetical protein
MSAFDLVGTSAPRPLPKWLPPIGGLLVGAVVASLVCRLPFSHSLSLRELIGAAVQRVLEVLLAAAITVWALCAISPQTTNLNTRRLILRTSLDALWLVPLALFLRENSAWAVAMAAVLVASAVKSFRFLQDISVPGDPLEDPGQSPALSPSRSPFSLTESSPYFRRQLSAAAVALCAQTGAIAAFAGDSFTASVLVGACSGVWTWSFTREIPSARPQPSAQSRSLSRASFILALAIIFTAVGLVPYLRHTYGIRGFGVPSRYHARQEFSQLDPLAQAGHDKTSDNSIAGTREGDPGVVLWPEKLTRTKLVAPAPVIGNTLLTSHRSAEPLVIPFEGVYWFFKAPDMHPPRSSREEHGSPELLDIRSTDHRPLSMEAHENLGSTIDLNCCSRIQIAIRNADHYPETVSMELVLINSSTPGKPYQSLGEMMVKSTRPWKLYDKRLPPVSETLNFAIPAASPLHRFDEVKIVFRIDAARADAGPRIAIDHLVLVPRGL